MNRLCVLIVAALTTVVVPVTHAQQGIPQSEKLLAAADRAAAIDGDLRAAIDQYKKALVAAGPNRTLAAQALLRMADCYQKLGDAEAQAIYTRLVRDYADQKDSAGLARVRLDTLPAVARPRSDWSVWAGQEADGFGTISPDGRWLTYTDWANGAALSVRDLTTGNNYRLTSGGGTQFSAISKDGRQVAYEWYTDGNVGPAVYELRIATLNAGKISGERRLYQNDDVTGMAPYDWSPDGKWIAVAVGRKDHVKQIGIVRVQDGALRVLKSLDWKEPTKIFFSPDSRYIGYDLPTDEQDQRHVFVMSVDGSRETAVVAHPSQNAIMGWSPDGRQVLFASDRSGSFGLWALPVEDGKPSGAATLLKTDIASSWSVGLSTAGTMYVWKAASPIYVQTSAIDLAAGKLGPTTFQQFISSRGRPDWSSDGKYLAYQSCAPLGGGPCSLRIRSMETSEVREVKTNLRYFFFLRWSPDGRELITRGNDLKGRNSGIYRLNVQTGEATFLMSSTGATLPQWMADGKHVVFRRGSSVVARDLTSGTERELAKLPTTHALGIALSPDERQVAYQAVESPGTEDLFVMNLEDGSTRSLLHVTAPEGVSSRFDWTASGTAIVVAVERDDTVANSLWLLPTTGEKPRKLDVNADHWLIGDGFEFDRAGKQVAFVAAAGQPGLEIRALENFLPAGNVSAATDKTRK
jgi:Tol biopolymer transport system component